jgi:type IV secretory pathway VirB9-like protein
LPQLRLVRQRRFAQVQKDAVEPSIVQFQPTAQFGAVYCLLTGFDELVRRVLLRHNYYIVDRLFAAAELRLGTDPQRVVRISRTDKVSGGVASNAGPRPRQDP